MKEIFMARPKLGESETERLQLKITAEEVAAIDDWRFANRVPSRSEAFRRLCRIGLIQQEITPAINKAMEGLIDSVMILSDETLTDRPRSKEEMGEMFDLAAAVFQKSYILYEKVLEQTIRLSGLANGDQNLKEALDWEGRAADFLEGKSLFESIKNSPEAYAALKAATEQRLKDAEEREKKE
jgi:hypothetical protein